MAIGATATFVAWKLADASHRRSFIVWQELGILDLVVAVSLGTTAVWLSPHSASMVAMTVLPLSLVPTFLVPLFLFFHISLHCPGTSLEGRFRRRTSNNKTRASLK
jgi:hypothetical protein